MRKILFISAFTPSKTSAGQNFSLRLLEDLALHSKVDLIYFQYANQTYVSNNPNIRVVKAVKLSAITRAIHAMLNFVFHPLFAVRFSWRLALQIRRMIKVNSYQLVYLDFSQVSLYSLFISHHTKLLMLHDVIAQKYSRKGGSLQRWWVSFTENLILRDPGLRLFVFSDKDALLVREYYQRDTTVVGFYLSPLITKNTGLQPLSSKTFCFFGAWNRPENFEGLDWFLSEVFPFLKKDLAFIIIGGDMPEKIMKQIRSNPQIRYTGFVENPYEIISRCAALIAPVFTGAGVKVKVIESLASGTPVIGTNVAHEGIPSKVSFGLFECTTSADFVQVIDSFSFEENQRLNLRQWFRDHYESGAARVVESLMPSTEKSSGIR